MQEISQLFEITTPWLFKLILTDCLFLRLMWLLIFLSFGNWNILIYSIDLLVRFSKCTDKYLFTCFESSFVLIFASDFRQILLSTAIRSYLISSPYCFWPIPAKESRIPNPIINKPVHPAIQSHDHFTL